MVMQGGYYVYVVSATGATGEMVLRAALTQFETSGVVVERMTQVRTIDVTGKSIEEAATEVIGLTGGERR
jgi:regulator of PEP synthase PpsR (kinase-PPPase family)